MWIEARSRMMMPLRLLALCFALLGAFAGISNAQQMPDPRQMSGVPLPMGDMPVGTVTVRIARGSLANIVPGQTVRVTGQGISKDATTDQSGRATFSGLIPGSRVKALATVDGETIESREFEVPSSGGIRIMLVAGLAGATSTAPAVQGEVVLGDQSRFVIEVGDEALNVYNVMQIMNPGSAPVQPPRPLVFDLPPAAKGAGLLEGSTQNATVAGNRVTVAGPFPPGSTIVQFAYSLPLGDETMTFEQKVPVALSRFDVVAQKLGAMSVSSPQITQHREMTAEGQAYFVGRGSGIPAGGGVALTLSGLPHRSHIARNVALGLACAILACGALFAKRRRTTASGARAQLQQQRERLLTQLASLEEQHRAGTIDQPSYAGQRRELMARLEEIYAALHEGAAA
jgi:hypothetical protein